MTRSIATIAREIMSQMSADVLVLQAIDEQIRLCAGVYSDATLSEVLTSLRLRRAQIADFLKNNPVTR